MVARRTDQVLDLDRAGVEDEGDLHGGQAVPQRQVQHLLMGLLQGGQRGQQQRVAGAAGSGPAVRAAGAGAAVGAAPGAVRAGQGIQPGALMLRLVQPVGVVVAAHQGARAARSASAGGSDVRQ
ncbi:hypothetical protein ACFQ0B_76040 [Nonomuraea thailandensis]